MAMRMRSGLSLLRRSLAAESPSTAADKFVAVVSSGSTSSKFTRNYADAPASKQQKVKVPVTMFGVSGNYASALYIAAVKANVLNLVESELISLVEGSKKSPMFTQFMNDASITSDTRVKAIADICSQAKFADITKNFLTVVAQAGRLGHLQRMVQRFTELTMAHRGEVKVTVTTVIIAARLPGRTDNEIKNFWNSTIKKRLKNSSSNNTATTNSSSPNNSDCSELKANIIHNIGGGGGGGLMGGTIFMQEYDVAAAAVCMDSSSSSCSSQFAFNPNHLIDHRHNIFDVPLFNLEQQDQVGGGGGGGGEILGDYGAMEPYVMALENDLSVPGLEVDNNNYGGVVMDKKVISNDGHYFNNQNNNIKVEEMVGAGNHWQGETFKMGEFDWEGLLANVSSLPYLDFHLQ